MLNTKIWRWLAGAGLAAGVIAATTHEAYADHRLFVLVDATNTACPFDANGNLIVGEAWGLDPTGTIRQCEALSLGGTAMGRCPATATEHRARIDARSNSTANLVSGSNPLVQSAIQGTWTAESAQISYQITGGAGCPGQSSTWYVASQGMEVPANPATP